MRALDQAACQRPLRSDVERALRLKSEKATSLLNAERIVNAVLRLVDAQDQATFAELDRHVPGFHARRKRDGR